MGDFNKQMGEVGKGLRGENDFLDLFLMNIRMIT